MALQRIGRERKPLGPPAKPGNCAAYDIFTAVLEDRPYPVKALLNFGSNTIMSTGDSQRAREAFRALDFAVAAELFMTPTAELCDYVLPATSFLEMGNLANDFKHRPAGQASCAVSSGRGRAAGGAALRYLDHFRAGETARLGRKILARRYRRRLRTRAGADRYFVGAGQGFGRRASPYRRRHAMQKFAAAGSERQRARFQHAG